MNNTTVEKSIFVSIIGRPNVGKSSLMNAMVGEKVAIVSNKPQTTRTRITGVLTKNEVQMVFLDTPGMHVGKTKLSEYMVGTIHRSVGDCDLVMMVINPDERVGKTQLDLLRDIQKSGMPAILVTNKIDTVNNKEVLLPLVKQFSEEYPFEHILFTSATKGDGIQELIEVISSFAVEAPHFFDDEAMTDMPERFLVSEIVREKVLRNMRDEIPHGIAVTIDRFHEREDKPLFDIDCTIYCERDSHKGMLIGKQGSMFKKILAQARQEIEQLLDCQVNIKGWVKVKEDWRNKESSIKNFGLKDE